MDIGQEEMQFLGFFGIHKEAYKLIFKWRKVFSQITLTLLILPLSFTFLGNYEDMPEIFSSGIGFIEVNQHHTKGWTKKYCKLSDIIPFQSPLHLHIRTDYFVFIPAFSLLSTPTVIYMVACAYTSSEITFKKVMSFIPMVLKRLMVTSLCVFFAFCAYHIVFALTLSLLSSAKVPYSTLEMVVLLIIIILYAVGFVYMSILWWLASVVSVLEESCGFKAMIKGKNLIKGKLVLAIAIFFKMNLSLAIINNLVIEFRVLSLVLSLILILSELVVQTVMYFVCKSYHHENVDKTALSDDVEVYLRRLRMLGWRVVISKLVFLLVTTITRVVCFFFAFLLGGSHIKKN